MILYNLRTNNNVRLESSGSDILSYSAYIYKSDDGSVQLVTSVTLNNDHSYEFQEWAHSWFGVRVSDEDGDTQNLRTDRGHGSFEVVSGNRFEVRINIPQEFAGYEIDRLESSVHVTGRRSHYFSYATGNGTNNAEIILDTPFTILAEWFNQQPSISLATSNNRTLYENDTYNISGTAQDSDAGDVVTVRYSINNGQERAIDTRISDGNSFSFNHTLTFRQGRLYRNDTAVTDELAEGSEHVLRVWVEDDNGGQSEVVQRSFYVVPNRMPELTVEPFGSRTDLIDSDKITFRGEASDPDGNDITVSYKINNGSYQQVYSGQGGAFEFQVAVGDLDAGENNVTIRSQDSYGAEVQKVLRVNKSGESVPLKTAVARYKITPPNGTAKGVVLWLQRETGDLIANARIHMGANGEPENFQDMTLEATSFVEDGIEEDEWTFDNGEEAENIILEITMERSSTSSDEGIKLINGVLS